METLSKTPDLLPIMMYQGSVFRTVYAGKEDQPYLNHNVLHSQKDFPYSFTKNTREMYQL